MKQTLKHSLLVTHRWLGWIFGFTNLVICITGGIYVFRTELTKSLVEMGYETTKLDTIFHFIIEGHQYLWLPPNIGKWIVGISVIAFLITAITGIIICIPYYVNNKLLFQCHKKGQWCSSVAGLTEYPAHPVHEERQIGYSVELGTEAFEFGIQ